MEKDNIVNNYRCLVNWEVCSLIVGVIHEAEEFLGTGW